MFHWVSTLRGAKHLTPLKQAHIGCVIDNGSQLLLKINNSLQISLRGIFASGSQVDGIRSLFVLLRVDRSVSLTYYSGRIYK
jgi:hypothetical protein